MGHVAGRPGYSEDLIMYTFGFCGVFFQTGYNFYHQTGNQTETYKDHQTGGKESGNEDQGVIQTE